MKFLSAGPAFIDTIESLEFEFKNDTSNSVVVCGGWELSKKNPSLFPLKEKFEKVIIFNQEQVGTKFREFLHPAYINWLKTADEVWDYDEENIKLLNNIRNNIKLHFLKPYKTWPETHKKDIDILFYGAMNLHRKKILDILGNKYKLLISNFVWGNNLDNLILRSKVLLNIHFYETCLQEQARMIRWIGSPCRIISEKSVHNYLGVEEMEYQDLFNLEI